MIGIIVMRSFLAARSPHINDHQSAGLGLPMCSCSKIVSLRHVELEHEFVSITSISY